MGQVDNNRAFINSEINSSSVQDKIKKFEAGSLPKQKGEIPSTPESKSHTAIDLTRAPPRQGNEAIEKAQTYLDSAQKTNTTWKTTDGVVSQEQGPTSLQTLPRKATFPPQLSSRLPSPKIKPTDPKLAQPLQDDQENGPKTSAPPPPSRANRPQLSERERANSEPIHPRFSPPNKPLPPLPSRGNQAPLSAERERANSEPIRTRPSPPNKPLPPLPQTKSEPSPVSQSATPVAEEPVVQDEGFTRYANDMGMNTRKVNRDQFVETLKSAGRKKIYYSPKEGYKAMNRFEASLNRRNVIVPPLVLREMISKSSLPESEKATLLATIPETKIPQGEREQRRIKNDFYKTAFSVSLKFHKHDISQGYHKTNTALMTLAANIQKLPGVDPQSENIEDLIKGGNSIKKIDDFITETMNDKTRDLETRLTALQPKTMDVLRNIEHSDKVLSENQRANLKAIADSTHLSEKQKEELSAQMKKSYQQLKSYIDLDSPLKRHPIEEFESGVIRAIQEINKVMERVQQH